MIKEKMAMLRTQGKELFAKANTKGKIIAASSGAAVAMAAPVVTAFAAENQEAGIGGNSVASIATIFGGVGSAITSIVTPVASFCASNAICLAFLSCTFVGVGARLVRRLINAFGRGR